MCRYSIGPYELFHIARYSFIFDCYTGKVVAGVGVKLTAPLCIIYVLPLSLPSSPMYIYTYAGELTVSPHLSPTPDTYGAMAGRYVVHTTALSTVPRYFTKNSI